MTTIFKKQREPDELWNFIGDRFFLSGGGGGGFLIYRWVFFIQLPLFCFFFRCFRSCAVCLKYRREIAFASALDAFLPLQPNWSTWPWRSGVSEEERCTRVSVRLWRGTGGPLQIVPLGTARRAPKKEAREGGSASIPVLMGHLVTWVWCLIIATFFARQAEALSASLCNDMTKQEPSFCAAFFSSFAFVLFGKHPLSSRWPGDCDWETRKSHLIRWAARLWWDSPASRRWPRFLVPVLLQVITRTREKRSAKWMENPAHWRGSTGGTKPV